MNSSQYFNLFSLFIFDFSFYVIRCLLIECIAVQLMGLRFMLIVYYYQVEY